MKPLCVIQAPYDTRSGYGEMARDIIRHIIGLDRYEVKLISLGWGACPMGVLDPNDPKDVDLIRFTCQPPIQLTRQPELFVQISVPNEFQAVGKYNIGITAGIETTLCSKEWIDGCNRMDLILTISEHSKRVFENTEVKQVNQQGQEVGITKLTKPIEVLHNCVHTDVFRHISLDDIPSSIRFTLKEVKEDFNFLFVGHWLKGNVGEDRKNVGLLVKVFCEAFKNKVGANRPGLILKTSGATFSIMDRNEILDKIRQIRASAGPNAPNVYLLHGELTEEEMNGLYNHPKVKAHISFTKGEGFGRPLLEATQSGKPVMASGWSGHLDFLTPEESVLFGGELKQVEASAVWENVIIPESQWFNVDYNHAARAMQFMMKHYGKFTDNARKLAKRNANKFSYAAIQERTRELMDKYVPRFAMPMPLKLPTLRKVTPPVTTPTEG